MELLYCIHIIIRNFWKIAASALLVAILSGAYAMFLSQPAYKTTVIFQTAAKVVEQADKGIDPLAYFEAADRFSEAMLGWFRNPIVFDDIASKADSISADTLSKIFSIRRQEKQNINITYTTSDAGSAKKLEDAIISYIKERIASINTESNSSYDIVNVASKTELVQASTLQFIVFGGLIGAVLSALLLFLWEYLRGVVMYPDQIEKIIGTKPIDTVRSHDAPFLTAYLQKLPGNLVVFSGTYGKPLLLGALQYLAQTLHIKKTLVDATETGFWAGKDAKGLGFMDVSDQKLTTKVIDHIPMIPRGHGSSPRFDSIRSQEHIILATDCSTGLVAIAHGFTPIVFVKLGVTKIQDLHRIRALQESAFHIFLIR